MTQKIIAIANQKGGVGKTTTVVNIAAGLKKNGKTVLCVDLDPQGNLSSYLGFENIPQDSERPIVITDLFKAQMSNSLSAEIAEKSILTSEPDGINYIPADITLSSADMFLATAIGREGMLKRILSHSTFSKFDYILIDCLPSLGVLVTNALVAAQSVIIPVQTQKFALNGIIQFEEIFNLVKDNLNADLKIEGILETMYDRTNMSVAVEEALKDRYGELVMKTRISKRIEASNSTAECRSLVNTKGSLIGQQYEELALEVIGKTL